MRRRILPFILAGGLSIAAVAPAAAAPNNLALQNALIGVLVQAVVTDAVDVNISDSLNNLLRDADILSNIEVRIVDVLNNLNVNISDINITVLENGDILVTILGAGGAIIDSITLT